jgi:transcriptional regulator with XRE-family HTH domain
MPAEKAAAERRSRRRGLHNEIEDGVGLRLREVRQSQDVSLREFARRLGLSPSALSQIETGRSRPSVGTLYGIVSELGMTLDELFATPGALPAPAAALPSEPQPAPQKEQAGRIQRAAKRKALQLDSGVRWERLNPTADPDIDFLYLVYDVGGASSRDGTYMRHMGREFGIVLSGNLRVTIGFDEVHELGPGDSIGFECSEPHRIENIGDEQVTAIWCVVGRERSDSRKLELDSDEGTAFGHL